MIDTHAHLNFAAYKDDFNQVRQNYLQVGISKIINIGTNLETSLESIELSQKFPEIYATIGIHPCDWNKYDAQVEEKFQQILNSPQAEKIVAIGECGIDLFHEEKFLNQQIAVFKAQIKIARQFDLPIIIHARNPKDPKQNPTKSHELALQILQEQNHTKAVFHCFMEELQFAEKLWKQGIYTGFNATITYPKNREKFIELLKNIPTELFLLETDCPFLPLQKDRGKRSEPKIIADLANFIAETAQLENIQNEALQNQALLMQQNLKNAQKIFKGI